MGDLKNSSTGSKDKVEKMLNTGSDEHQNWMNVVSEAVKEEIKYSEQVQNLRLKLMLILRRMQLRLRMRRQKRLRRQNRMRLQKRMRWQTLKLRSRKFRGPVK